MGRPLNSGANRGDWLYAAAVRFFGSWGAAVEKAGFAYPEARQANLGSGEVLRRIRVFAASGDPLRASDHPVVTSGARRHFGSWQAAVEAAGCELPFRGIWTHEKVVATLRADREQGLPINSTAIIARHQALYGAARKRFGSYAAALAVVDPAMPPPRRGRPAKRTTARDHASTSSSKERRWRRARP